MLRISLSPIFALVRFFFFSRERFFNFYETLKKERTKNSKQASTPCATPLREPASSARPTWEGKKKERGRGRESLGREHEEAQEEKTHFLPTPRRRPRKQNKKMKKLFRMLDAAFVDRADVVLHLGPPPAVARYSMLAASVAELCRARIVRGVELAPTLGGGGGGGGGGASGQPLSSPSSSSSSALLPLSLPEEAFSSSSSSSSLLPPLAARLAEIAAATEGLSGRSLRRLPFAALADAVGLSGLEEASSSDSSSSSGIDAFVFMEALKAAAEAERASRGYL